MVSAARAAWCLVWALVLGGTISSSAKAGESQLIERTAHTFALAAGATPMAAELEDLSMLIGSWTGGAFGKRFEAVWNPPSNGSMVGMFKLLNDEGVDFYELLVIRQQEESLAINVKHFTEDFVAWEDKSDYITFKLLKAEADAIHFSGLSFYRKGENAMEGYIVMRGKDDSITEHKLSYQRVP